MRSDLDLDKEALGHLVHGGLAEMQRLGIRGEHIEGPWKEAVDLVLGQAREGQVLTAGDLKLRLGVSVEKPQTSVGFIGERLRNRMLFNLAKRRTLNMTRALERMEPGSVFREMEEALREAYREDLSGKQLRNLLDYAPDVKRAYIRAKNGQWGIPSPWPSLTREILGYRGGDLVVYAARTGVGKTVALLLNLVTIWNAGFRPLLVVTEMEAVEMATRFIAMYCKLDASRLRYGQLTTYEEDEFFEKVDKISGLVPIPMMGGDFKVHIDAIHGAMLAARPDVVLVDGLYLIDAPGRDRHERVSAVADDLKAMAKRFGVPILTSTQFTRKVNETDPSKVKESDIGITDVIGWNSDLIIGLFQDEDMAADRKMKMRTLKNRRGSAWDWVSWWDFDRPDFSEIMAPGDAPEPRGPQDVEARPRGVDLGSFMDDLDV